MSPEKYAEMIRERDKALGRTIPEPVGKWLESQGIDVDAFLRLEPLLKKYESLSDEQKSRFEELKDFKPNPGKAELNEIGKTVYPVFGDMGGAPIYQEDIDMIRKSLPVVKKLLEIQRRNTRLDDTSLLTGPDTTENIKEVYEIDDEGMRPAEKYAPGKDYIYSPMVDNKGLDEVREMEKKLKPQFSKTIGYMEKEYMENNIKDSGDIMFGMAPEAQVLRGDQDVMLRREQDLVDLQHDTRGIDDKMYPSKEDVTKAMEKSNKNVSKPEIEEEEVIRARKDFEEYLRKEGEKEKFSYSAILKRMDDTHTRKNNDYGDAAYQGYKKYGDYYFLVQLHNKMSRLESLTVNKKAQMVKDESIDDTLLDMANYAIMFLESRHRND